MIYVKVFFNKYNIFLFSFNFKILRKERQNIHYVNFKLPFLPKKTLNYFNKNINLSVTNQVN